MITCVVQPYTGLSIEGFGDIRFGDSIAQVEAVLGSGDSRRSWDGSFDNLSYMDETKGLLLRFGFGVHDRTCSVVEFLSPGDCPPTVYGRQLTGPSMREAAELIRALGHEPWGTRGPLLDLASALRLDPDTGEDVRGPEDTVYFHRVGLGLWTDTSTETRDGRDIGEFVLQSAMIWQRGFLERQNEVWRKIGSGAQIAIPPVGRFPA